MQVRYLGRYHLGRHICKGRGRTFAKYLQTFSAAAPRSWLKGQAAPA